MKAKSGETTKLIPVRLMDYQTQLTSPPQDSTAIQSKGGETTHVDATQSSTQTNSNTLDRKVEAMEHTIDALRTRIRELEVEIDRLKRLHHSEHTTLDRDAAATLVLGY